MRFCIADRSIPRSFFTACLGVRLHCHDNQRNYVLVSVCGIQRIARVPYCARVSAARAGTERVAPPH